MSAAELARRSLAELEALAAAARAIAAADAELATAGGAVAAALGGAAAAAWQHYPAGDVYDPRSHAQFFYHAHPPGERAVREHGHFHAFLRARGMPAGVRPLVLPELAIAGSPGAPLAPSAPAGEAGEPWCHLVAVATDGKEPIRLFTTNRWVTGETWYRAPDVAAMLPRFALGQVGPLPALNRWVTGVIALFRPEIETLLKERDKAVMAWRERRRGKVHVFEDRRLEIASSLEIALGSRIEAVEAALGARLAAPQTRPRSIARFTST